MEGFFAGTPVVFSPSVVEVLLGTEVVSDAGTGGSGRVATVAAAGFPIIGSETPVVVDSTRGL